ncbi:hypothetical protein HMPREF1580_01166, partial [Gardnerella vaginalis JCP8070]
REKAIWSAEPLKAEALLLRGEDVSALRPRERNISFSAKNLESLPSFA